MSNPHGRIFVLDGQFGFGIETEEILLPDGMTNEMFDKAFAEIVDFIDDGANPAKLACIVYTALAANEDDYSCSPPYIYERRRYKFQLGYALSIKI